MSTVSEIGRLGTINQAIKHIPNVNTPNQSISVSNIRFEHDVLLSQSFSDQLDFNGKNSVNFKRLVRFSRGLTSITERTGRRQ